jgi:hypothetical protein
MGGRTGTVKNLFKSLAKCAWCDAPMQLVSKGHKPKIHNYLVCGNEFGISKT